MQEIVKNFTLIHVDAPGQEEGAAAFPSGYGHVVLRLPPPRLLSLYNVSFIFLLRLFSSLFILIYSFIVIVKKDSSATIKTRIKT